MLGGSDWRREVARRREIVRAGAADARIEGQTREPETDAIFDAFVQGEIEVTDIVPLLKAHYGLT